MIPTLLSLLLACGTSTAPPPAVSDDVPEEAPPPSDDLPAAGLATPSPGAVMVYESVAVLSGDILVGDRLWSDGLVEQGVGTLSAPNWRGVRNLGPERVALVERLLSEPDVTRLPDRLPRPPNLEVAAPRARWQVTTPEGEVRTIRADSLNGVRVPILEKLDEILRGSTDLTLVRTLASITHDGRTRRFHLPCNPTQAIGLRPFGTTIFNDKLPKAAPSTAPEILRIDAFAKHTAWSATLHADGRIHRIDEEGRERWTKVTADTVERLEQLIAMHPWDDAAKACAPDEP